MHLTNKASNVNHISVIQNPKIEVELNQKSTHRKPVNFEHSLEIENSAISTISNDCRN